MSDNRNRTVQEVRSLFVRSGGSLSESGSVTWLFDSRGLITVETANLDADELALQAIDAGAEDVNTEPGIIEIFTKPEELEAVRAALEKNKVTICSAELARVPKTTVQLDEHTSSQVLTLLEKLEELDDTRSVCSNVDFSNDFLEKHGR